MSSEVEKAKEFWRDVDFHTVFDALYNCLHHLREEIEAERATDRELILGMNIILAADLFVNEKSESASIEDTLISTEIVAVGVTEGDTVEQESEEGSACEQELNNSMLSQCDSGLPPPAQFHACSLACLSCSSLSAHHFWGHNPLKVPLMWGFQRLHGRGAGPESHVIFYKAPCGRSLRGAAEVLRYLHETEADALLHAGNFSFSASVLLQDRAPSPGGAGELLDPDLSKGAEPVPVQLWNAVDGERPEKFRYRTHTRPRSCLPGSGPVYSACCDCTDGCVDKRKCSCLQLSLRAAHPSQLYCYRRLPRPTPTGIYECGPWCGCDRARCENRIVQHGVQVQLQVFRTQDQGWGVRCLDDLDRGTFICTYTGVVLQAELGSGAARSGLVPSDPSPVKRKRAEQSSDDEVEVVEDWRVAAGETDLPPSPAPPSSPAHVSVIRTPTGLGAAVLDSEQAKEEPQPAMSPSSETSPSHWLLPQTHTDADNGEFEGSEEETGPNPRRVAEQEGWAWLGEGRDTDKGACHSGTDEEHLYYLDATEEGNVGRFLNHSCSPNLFVQNVFIDSHHRDFPTVAFFTSRPVTARTELTWNYSYDPGSAPEQEVPCQCGFESCQGALI
ncbi:hypothetical protein AAFF_G00308500 [Aldrovandia affinis]|uniref:Histone-lysine N-methyltransferase SETDB2 n=1 Tax=Aldrovandia affinis TaxID=143900 RepID=A0AAD7SNI4_9TELE|nr:hypothetical protein AAFF_G00308500 [Aldrovandia affinis]